MLSRGFAEEGFVVDVAQSGEVGDERALALGEVRLRDVFRVVAREVSAGVLLGLLLGAIAFGRALLWKVGIDPTVVSAPLITTLVDASGLFIYFTVAHLMIAQLHA